MPISPALMQRLQNFARGAEKVNAYGWPAAATVGTYYGIQDQVEDPVARALLALSAGSFAQPRAFIQAWKGRNAVPHASSHLASRGQKMDPVSGFLEGLKPALKTKAALAGLSLVPALATSSSSAASNIAKTTAEAAKAAEGAVNVTKGAEKTMGELYKAGENLSKFTETNSSVDLNESTKLLNQSLAMVPKGAAKLEAGAKKLESAVQQIGASPLNSVIGGATGAGLGLVAGNTMGSLFQDPSGNSAEDKATRRRNARIRALLSLGAGATGGFAGYRIGQGKNPLDDLARLKDKAAEFMPNFTR